MVAHTVPIAVFSHLPATGWCQGDYFTPQSSLTGFSELRGSLVLMSPPLRPPKARHSSKPFPEDASLIAGWAPRPAINKIVLPLPLTEETPGWHQPVWNQLFLSLWSPQYWLSKLPGRLLRPRYRPCPADNPSKALCGHCMWGGDHLSKWLVTTPSGLREAFLMQGRW